MLHDKNIIYNFNCEKGQNTVYINTMKRIERREDNSSKKSAEKLFKAHPGALYTLHAERESEEKIIMQIFIFRLEV